MKQGTVSVLFGCHSVVHSLLVYISWVKLYHRLPRPWETVCICLHDVGHWGKDYLDNIDEKRQHWVLGARIAGKLFGRKGFILIAGHDVYSGYLESNLRKPDKYSFSLAPKLWLLSNLFIEPRIRNNNLSRWQHLSRFKEEVKKNIESGEYRSPHDLWQEQKQWTEEGK